MLTLVNVQALYQRTLHAYKKIIFQLFCVLVLLIAL